jgi:3-oxoacyl-[acyl-carrier protein] reductase
MTTEDRAGGGRAVLVTGASRGIGRAVARAFAAHGDRVAVHYHESAAPAERLVAELPGRGHVAVQADLADAEAVRHMVEAAAGALGGIDVLVNNAAVFFDHPILETGYAEWQSVWRRELDVNLIGAANVTWCAVRHMGAGGRIVNLSSRTAFSGETDSPADAASKAGLTAFGQSLATALAPSGIAVAAVAPGFVETDMTRECLKGPGGDAVKARSPFGRVAQPEDVAAAVVYLASPEAEWASGAVLELDGGSHLRP